MKILIINNLASGKGTGVVYDFVRHLAADGDEIILRCTDGGTDLRTFLHDTAEFDLVVAAGGDGTVATVLHETRNTGVPVLPFPAGTANLLTTNNVASPSTPEALAIMARKLRALDFDLAELETGGEVFGFNIIAGAGYDAVIMKEAEPAKKTLGSLAYVGAALTNVTPTRSHITLDLDGEVVEADGVGVLVMNFSKIKYDLAITHENTPRDGLLDVVILKTRNAFELLPAVGAALLDLVGDFSDRPADVMEVHRCRSVKVVADPPLPIQFDGEPVPHTTPFAAKVLPGAGRIVLSRNGYELFATEDDPPVENWDS